MRNRKSHRCKIYKSYKNYGSTPRNEYTTTNAKNNTNSFVVLEPDTQADATMYKQSSPKQRVQYPESRGWKRPWRVNGWRAELASRHDECIGVGRYCSNVRENIRAITMVCFNLEEMNLICIYKADTRGETLSNMQAARIYIDDPDMLVILDSAVDKLDNMTDAAFSEIAFDPAYEEESMVL